MLVPLLPLLPLLLAGCSREAPAAPSHCAAAERHDVLTADGAALALHRHPADGPPVLIVHGISSNHHSWDLSADRSLGVWLAAEGYDAWLLDLRGHGDSTRDARGHAQRSGWSVDDYGQQDIPAAVAHVLQVTGAE